MARVLALLPDLLFGSKVQAMLTGAGHEVEVISSEPDAWDQVAGSDVLLKERFPDSTYVDAPGLCKVATLAEIEAQGWSLNPGRYTGTAAIDDDGGDFTEKLSGLYDEFTGLSDEADVLRKNVDVAIQGILSL